MAASRQKQRMKGIVLLAAAIFVLSIAVSGRAHHDLLMGLFFCVMLANIIRTYNLNRRQPDTLTSLQLDATPFAKERS